jgi:hypothetical protein
LKLMLHVFTRVQTNNMKGFEEYASRYGKVVQRSEGLRIYHG